MADDLNIGARRPGRWQCPRLRLIPARAARAVAAVFGASVTRSGTVVMVAVFVAPLCGKDVDGRAKPGHDGGWIGL
jgi:hypothetical protein